MIGTPFRSKTKCMLSVEEISNLEQLNQSKERFDNLIRQSDCCAPYLNFEWYRSALETIDSDKQPMLLFFKTSGNDIGLAPLVGKKLSRWGLICHIISFIENPYTPYQGLIYIDKYKDILTNLIGYLQNRYGGLFFLDLDEIRLTHEEEKIIKYLAANDFILLRMEEKPGSRYLILKENFEYTRNTLNKKTQKEFRRKIRRLSNLGVIDLVKIQGDNQIVSHLDRFFKFYARTWKGEEPHPEFYYRLCKQFDTLGRLYFYALTLDARPIAYLICLSGKDTMYGIKTTYNPSYYAFSPGVILFYKCIEDMFNIPGIREFDIGRGNEQFKREWTSLVHPHTRLLIYPNTVFWQISNRIRYDMLPRMKKYRSFEIFYSALRSQWLHGDNSRINGSSETRKIVKKRITIEDYIGIPVTDRYLVRYAEPGDLDHLAVAMSAHNFRQVQQRMDRQRCILILRGNRILAYFWLVSHGETECENDTNSEEVFIDNYGISEDLPSEYLEKEFIPIMLKFMGHEKPGTKAVVLTSSPSLPM